MTVKIIISAYYDGSPDPEIDEKLREVIETTGAEWYAQGFAFQSEIRDMSFELDLDI